MYTVTWTDESSDQLADLWLAVATDDLRHAIPTRGQGMRFDARQRRHAEIEPAIALRLTDQHELREQIIHRPPGRLLGKPHQVNRQLFLLPAAQHIRKRDNA